MSMPPSDPEDPSSSTPTKATFAKLSISRGVSANETLSHYNKPDDQSNLSSDGSETETEMPDRRSEKHREGSNSSSKSSSSKSSLKSSSSSKSKTKTDDWSDVIEPDERRRIQNRIAQRKFREKAKEQKETKERDAENQQRAGQIYTTPEPRDMEDVDLELSGLPWGSISLRHVVERGKARRGESYQGSPDYSSYDHRSGGGGSGRASSDQ